MLQGLHSGTSLQVGGELSVHLGEVLVDVLVSLFESLFGELGDLALHHALLVPEETV